MTVLKKRLLLSLSAAALAAPMAAGSVHAIEVVVLEQVNNAAQTAELSFDELWGESLAATAAAIGNSAAFNVEGETDAAALDLKQMSTPSAGGRQLAEIVASDVDLAAGTTEGLDLTAAAIGNTLSGTGLGQVTDIAINQFASGFPVAQSSVITLDEVVVGGLESSLSAAAIGNSASLTAGAIGTGDGFDTVSQSTFGGQTATIDIADLAVLPDAADATFDATAAALNNSLTLSATTGDLYLDSLFQMNSSAQTASVGLGQINVPGSSSTPVGVAAPSYESFDSTLVAAAIASSASLDAEGTVLLGAVTQNNMSAQLASIGLDQVYGLGDLDVTSVAIANSLSIDAGGMVAIDPGSQAFGQTASGTQTAIVELVDLGMEGAVAVTAAALGNSLSIDAGGDAAVSRGSFINQMNIAHQSASVVLDGVEGLDGLRATVVAIGNSLSLASGGDLALYEGDAAPGPDAIFQTGGFSQTATLDLTELNGTGAGEVTLAAIDNSLSIEAEGTLSGVTPSISQTSFAPQIAELTLAGSGGFASLDATAVAIGNSLSLSAGAFEGTGTLSAFQQNGGLQTVSLTMTDSGMGALSATTAAIGNSASVSIR
ncbi:hypothetical protein [Marinimicrococcus flavescens]|uniref:Choice-of-anchor G family protein n=1 Tax=Marinimicrococcus flavescens TaxID=3031815 RepID=A0AAP3XQH3_9PROT|nr:hypothetical protein [Marinimicrococcus flavescens]